MMSNGGGLKITEKCKIPGYKYLVWYSKKAITNIICLKNLIKCYRVTYDSELDTTYVVHRSAGVYIVQTVSYGRRMNRGPTAS